MLQILHWSVSLCRELCAVQTQTSPTRSPLSVRGFAPSATECPKSSSEGQLNLTNPPAFVRERPKAGGFKHISLGPRICASKAQMPHPLWKSRGKPRMSLATSLNWRVRQFSFPHERFPGLLSFGTFPLQKQRKVHPTPNDPAETTSQPHPKANRFSRNLIQPIPPKSTLITPHPPHTSRSAAAATSESPRASSPARGRRAKREN